MTDVRKLSAGIFWISNAATGTQESGLCAGLQLMSRTAINVQEVGIFFFPGQTPCGFGVQAVSVYSDLPEICAALRDVMVCFNNLFI